MRRCVLFAALLLLLLPLACSSPRNVSRQTITPSAGPAHTAAARIAASLGSVTPAPVLTMPPASAIAAPTGGVSEEVTPAISKVITPVFKPLAGAAAAQIAAFWFVDARHGWLARDTQILASSDGGRSWTERGQVPAPVLDLDFVSREQGWAVTHQRLYRTEDAGRSWQVVAAISPTPGNGADVGLRRVRFVDARHGWLGDDRAIRATSDGGLTWAAIADPCFGVISIGLFSFITPAQGWILCGGEPGAGMQAKWLYKTADGGSTWQLIAEDGWAKQAGQGAAPVTLPTGGYAFDLFFLDASHGWYVGNSGGIGATTDGGLAWIFERAIDSGGVFLNQVQWLSLSQGFVSSNFPQPELWVTGDGGASWTQPYPPLWPAMLTQLIWFDPQHGLATEATFGGDRLFATADGGLTWTVKGRLPEPADDITFPDPQHGWATSSQALYRTTDGGATWTLVDHFADPRDHFVGVSFVDPQTGYLVQEPNDLLFSYDGGLSFEPVQQLGSMGVASHVQFVDKLNGWSENGDLYSTNDGGETWNSVPAPLPIASMAALTRQHVWIATDNPNRLYFTGDGGNTWTQFNLGTIAPDVIGAADANHVWLSDGSDHAYRSQDGGRTWLQIH